jgi:predicted RNase H-like nuclease (RuvC/YqgF family)
LNEVAIARINTFGPSPKADSVPPSEQTISLSYGQLQELIKESVEQAIEPLQDHIEALDATVANQGEEIVSLRSTVASLESLQERDTTRICLDIAYDRKRLAKLEHPTKEPGKTELSRAEKIERYLAGRPNHQASFETLKGVLQINNVLLNQTIKILMDGSPGRYGVTKAPGDKRKRTLVMLPR